MELIKQDLFTAEGPGWLAGGGPPPGLECHESDKELGHDKELFMGKENEVRDKTHSILYNVSPHPLMVQGLTRIEGSRGRMDTLIEIFKETRQTDGRLQVYLVRELWFTKSLQRDCREDPSIQHDKGLQ